MENQKEIRDPLSTESNLQDEDDIKLREFVEGSHMFETDFELNYRKSVLTKLEEMTAQLGGRLLWSEYVLFNAYSPSASDIDAYYVAPTNKTFDDLLNLLTTKLERKPEIRNDLLPSIQSLVELNFEGITIRLVHVNVELEEVPNPPTLKSRILSTKDFEILWNCLSTHKRYKRIVDKYNCGNVYNLAMSCWKLYALRE